eukprot:TRINITY_DN11200_c0_g1_i5.p1 TRINITY_DN11200_c0_g1~~TRINITY_DN11200_c0_g1_i5.p1  ORF type:complete len:641 (+),score=98.32 TRINITY_DN11200_c0_g1_i5:94-2016(+)
MARRSSRRCFQRKQCNRDPRRIAMTPHPELCPINSPRVASFDEDLEAVSCDNIQIVIEDTVSTQPCASMSRCTTTKKHNDPMVVLDSGIHIRENTGVADDGVVPVEIYLQRFEKILFHNMSKLTETVESLVLLSTYLKGVDSNGKPSAISSVVDGNDQTQPSIQPKGGTASHLDLLPGQSSATLETDAAYSHESTSDLRFAVTHHGGTKHIDQYFSAKTRNRNVSINVSTLMDYALATDILWHLPENLRESTTGGVWFCLRQLQNSTLFTVFVMSALLVSTITYGIQVDNLISHGEVNPVLESIETSCTVTFTIELLIRIPSYGGKFDGSLMFDACIVAAAWLDLIFRIASKDLNTDVSSMLTIVRSARSLRLCRLVCFLPQVRVVILTIISSMNALFWLLLVMLCVIFVFAVVLTEGAGQVLQRNELPDDLVNDLKHDFGSVVRSMYTLFQSVVGGVSWGEPARLTLHFGVGYFVVFLGYISLMMFSVLNVVLGFFVDGAIQLMERDRELCNMRLHEQNKHIAEDLGALLSCLDTNSDGEISYGEWLHAVADRDTRELLEVLGFDVSDARQLFHMIDVDDSGLINLRELVLCMQRVSGKVTGIHMDLVLRRLERLAPLEKLVAKLDERVRTLTCARGEQ